MNAPSFPELSARDAQALFERVAGNIEQVMVTQETRLAGSVANPTSTCQKLKSPLEPTILFSQ